MNFRHEVNRSQMETFVIDDVLYLMALGLFEKGCQQVIRHDLNFVFQYLAFYTVGVFDYLCYSIGMANSSTQEKSFLVESSSKKRCVDNSSIVAN